MTRIELVALLGLAAAGCYAQAETHAVPAAVVNDACGKIASADACATVGGCEWRALAADCPAGTACSPGVCVTPDPCAALSDRATCEADRTCAWSGQRPASSSIDLCPVGESCAAGGYCHTRDASGGGCTCVRPIACPANADCPAVACDCSSGGGGTCTCACPPCLPGETCPPCSCDCGSAGGGSCGGGAVSGGTCTCACPVCPAGAACAPCECACGAGNVGVGGGSSGTPTTMVDGGGPAGSESADPCAGHGDAKTCAADSANACHWIELGIVCITAPCPSGMCIGARPAPADAGTDAGGGGCGCACAACIEGQSCPPCACDCCGPTPTPVPMPA